MNFILASASPRRAELLRSAGLEFDIRSAEIDESPLKNEESEALVSRLSLKKAEAVSASHPHAIILAADTVVEHDGTILGKPENKEDAFGMLSALSGDRHEVMTGFTIMNPNGKTHTEVVVTEVQFRTLSEEEMHSYIESGDPLDKAGAYGIQSGAAGFVKRIEGSYTNVVGLPLAEVLEYMSSIGTPACDRDQRERTS